MKPTHLIYANGDLYGSLTGLIKGMEHYYEVRYKYNRIHLEPPTAMVFFLDEPGVDLGPLIDSVFQKYAPDWELRDFDPSQYSERYRNTATLEAHRSVKKVWRKKIKDELLPLMMKATGLPPK